jgi:hypothetical protein
VGVSVGARVAMTVSVGDGVSATRVSVGPAVGCGLVVAGLSQAVRASRTSINRDNQCKLRILIVSPSSMKIRESTVPPLNTFATNLGLTFTAFIVFSSVLSFLGVLPN